MPCIEPGRSASAADAHAGAGPWTCTRLALAFTLVCTAAGCSSPLPPWPGSTPPPPPRQLPPVTGPTTREAPPPLNAPAVVEVPPAALPSRVPARHWDDYRVQAARRMVAANPNGSYMSEVPEPLLAIPVLEIELNGDGSVRQVVVMRTPRQAKDTVQLAIAAVHRAAPFAPVTHLPRPWKFSEVFLFNDDRRFKPRSLD